MKPSALLNKLIAISRGCLIGLGCIVSVMSALGLFGALSSILEIFSHFRWQYGILLLILGLLCVKRKGICAVFCVSAAYNLILVGVLYLPIKNTAATRATHEISLLDMNILYSNRSPALINQEIQSVSADVVVIEELTPKLYQALQPGLHDYPYRVFSLREDPFGVGIFSKTRFISSSDNPIKIPVPLAVSAVVRSGGKPMEIIAVHLLPPLRLIYSDINKHIVDLLGKTARDFSGPKLIIGDFNATPWSALFLRLCEQSGLHDTESGFGLQTTWPCGDPLMQIPIDHCLISSDCKVTQRSLGNETGSDHRPLVIRLLAP